jgi:hypothetical protein
VLYAGKLDESGVEETREPRIVSAEFCDGDHKRPVCKSPQCWHRDPLDPVIDSELVMFRTPDGEAIYLDEIEARALGEHLVRLADQLQKAIRS